MQSDLPAAGSAPMISVVVAVFNADKTLEQCLRSISDQTYRYIQLIVIDGGSTDGTLEVIKWFDDKIDYWVSEPDKGIYDAWNKALAKVKGDWVCFLGGDDFFWDPQVLEKVAEYLERLGRDSYVAYGTIMAVNETGEALYSVGQPWSVVGGRFKALMSIPHPGTMHRADLFHKHGKFDASFKIAGDYDLLLRELKNGQATFMENVTVAGVRQGGVSNNPQNVLRAMYEIRRAQVRSGIVFPPLLWIITVTKVYLRSVLDYTLGHDRADRLLAVVRKCPGVTFNWTGKH